MKTPAIPKILFATAMLMLGLPGCSSYYQDEVRAPSEQELEDARTGRDMEPRKFLRDGVFHMQRVQHGSSVRVADDIVLKKPDLPAFDVAYISRDLESVLLELAHAAGESIVLPDGIKGRRITLVHSGANFTQMLGLVLNKAGYHYNYVDGVWYITRYPIRNYILEIGQSTRKGALIANTELAAETASGTNASGSDITTEYADTIWNQVDQTMIELIKVGQSDLSSSGGGGGGDYTVDEAASQGLIENQAGQMILNNNGSSGGSDLPPPTVEGSEVDERMASVLAREAEVQTVNLDSSNTSGNYVSEEQAEPWYKITESAGLITVRAAPEAHRLIEEYLEQVQEAAHRQIVVEARIVAIIRDKTTNRGFQLSGNYDSDGLGIGSLGWTPASELDPTNLMGGFFQLSASPNNSQDLTAIIQSLSSIGDVYTLSSPSVLARNNQMSRVSVTRQLGYVETEVETATGSSGDVSIGSRIDRANYKSAGTVMSVIPFIGKNGVQMRFRLSVATQSGNTTVRTSIGDSTPVENNVPNLANNVIDQDMILEFGRVYAIGGLVETSTNIDSSYEPTLSQIPGMKEVFRRATNEREDTEFLVLIRVSRS